MVAISGYGVSWNLTAYEGKFVEKLHDYDMFGELE